MIQEFQAHKKKVLTPVTTTPRPTMNIWWQAPPLGLVKINVDALVYPSDKGIGVVSWDIYGWVIVALTQYLVPAMEAQAVIRGIYLA